MLIKNYFCPISFHMRKNLLIIISLFTILLSCKRSTKTDETPLHGIIRYSVSYSDAIKENSLYSFFPKELTSVFKDDHFKIQAKGALNMYQFELVNSGADSTFALVQFFDQKFICSLNSSDNNKLNNLLSSATVQFYNDSVVNIAGLNSNLMTINFKNPERTRISVYYADNNAIEKNKSSFSLIPGIVTRMIIEHTGNSGPSYRP